MLVPSADICSGVALATDSRCLSTFGNKTTEGDAPKPCWRVTSTYCTPCAVAVMSLILLSAANVFFLQVLCEVIESLRPELVKELPLLGPGKTFGGLFAPVCDLRIERVAARQCMAYSWFSGFLLHDYTNPCG